MLGRIGNGSAAKRAEWDAAALERRRLSQQTVEQREDEGRQSRPTHGPFSDVTVREYSACSQHALTLAFALTLGSDL